MLRLINRLIDPSEGTVRVGGEDVRTVDPIVLRRRIGYVFQGIGLFPHMTVAENIAITPRLPRPGRRRHCAARDELLDLVRLDRTTIGSAFRMNCPAANASASASPARWPIRASC